MCSARADWHEFASPDALAKALADKVAAALGEAIEQRGSAFIAVSGGSTPKRFFKALSTRDLDWSRVTVTLADERFVEENSDRSNAALVRSLLLTGKAAAAHFEGLFRPLDGVEEAARTASAELSACSWPLDVAVLGMGTDGHTASFFPDAEHLDALLDPAEPAYVLPVHAPGAGEPRLTLPLGRFVEAGTLLVHIEGKEKRDVLQAALEPGGDKPVSAVFAHAHKVIPVYWAG